MWRKPSEVLCKPNDGLLQRISTLSILLLGGLFASYCSLVSLGLFVKKKNSLSSVLMNYILFCFLGEQLSFNPLMFRVCLILEFNSTNLPL